MVRLFAGSNWDRPLRPGHPAQRRDVAFIGCWLSALAVLLLAGLVVDLPPLLWQLAALGSTLQTLGVGIGLLLPNPRPEDYHDHKYLG